MALRLFHSDPSRVQVGSYVKIGRFSGNADLLYQDVLEDSLIKIADKVIDLIYLKGISKNTQNIVYQTIKL